MLLTEKQAAVELQIDIRTVRRLINSQRLRAIDVGSGKRRSFRIDPADIRLISSHQDSPPVQLSPVRVSRRRRLPQAISVSSYLPTV